MVSMLTLSVVDRGFEPRSSQTKVKDYKIGICCFSTKHTALRRKSRLVSWKIAELVLNNNHSLTPNNYLLFSEDEGSFADTEDDLDQNQDFIPFDR